MYLEACGQPQLSPFSPEPPYFSSSSRGERYFCSGCGCPLWFRLTDTDRYFIPWTLLELNEVDRRRLILAAEFIPNPACFLATDGAIRTPQR